MGSATSTRRSDVWAACRRGKGERGKARLSKEVRLLREEREVLVTVSSNRGIVPVLP